MDALDPVNTKDMYEVVLNDGDISGLPRYTDADVSELRKRMLAICAVTGTSPEQETLVAEVASPALST